MNLFLLSLQRLYTNHFFGMAPYVRKKGFTTGNEHDEEREDIDLQFFNVKAKEYIQTTHGTQNTATST